MQQEVREVSISPNREYKDRLFRDIFEKDKEALLELYNALNGTDYKNPNELQTVTIENVLYMSMRNDVAFVIAGMLNLYEHQSTFNPNMPLRFLWYVGQEFQMLIQERKENQYGSKLIMLPAPKCVVFYNGDKNMPDRQVLRLTDAFGRNAKESCLELTVQMLNINFKHNEELMLKCKKLGEYAYLMNEIKSNLQIECTLEQAIEKAIDTCITNGILEEYLRKNKAEVFGMLLTEYNEKEYLSMFKRDAREEGLEEGRQEGRQE
ncbi:MAG: hypothetical protein IJ282_10415, partial [Lachnospiraceae bacterium]|nr:hypothetical protein [Lachnospiraceae bacterium]